MYHQFKELADVDITQRADGDRPDLSLRDGRGRGRPRHPGERGHRPVRRRRVLRRHARLQPAGRQLARRPAGLRQAGRRAAAEAVRRRPRATARPAIAEDDVKAAAASALAPFEVEGGENPYTIQQDLQQSMNDLVGIIRDRRGARASRSKEIEAFKERAKSMVVEGHRQYNPGWHLSIDLRNMLIVSESIAKAALARQESRGGHTRDDFPQTDSRGLGQEEPDRRPQRQRRRRGAHREATAGDAGRAQEVLRGELTPWATT